jgi:hypothetical protein
LLTRIATTESVSSYADEKLTAFLDRHYEIENSLLSRVGWLRESDLRSNARTARTPAYMKPIASLIALRRAMECET